MIDSFDGQRNSTEGQRSLSDDQRNSSDDPKLTSVSVEVSGDELTKHLKVMKGLITDHKNVGRDKLLCFRKLLFFLLCNKILLCMFSYNRVINNLLDYHVVKMKGDNQKNLVWVNVSFCKELNKLKIQYIMYNNWYS